MPHKYRDFQEAFDALNDETTEEFLREDAKASGLTWGEYCYKYGLVGTTQERRIRRHEVATYQEMEREVDDDGM